MLKFGIAAGVAGGVGLRIASMVNDDSVPAHGANTTGQAQSPRPEGFAAGEPQPMSREWFLPHQGSSFIVDAPGEIPLNLIKVSPPRDQRAPGAVFTCFSLLFESAGTAATGLTASVHRLRHAALGEFEVFLSPVGLPENDGRVKFEAVFSRRLT